MFQQSLCPNLSTDGAANGHAHATRRDGVSVSLSASAPDTDSRADETPSTTTKSAKRTYSANERNRILTTYDSSIFDWDAESRPPTDIADTVSALDSPVVAKTPRVIVLTGISGLLGHHLLDYLLSHTTVEKVICLAVRQLATRLQTTELPSHPRVVYHEGDLSFPLLGLNAHDAASIFAETEAVIHNGADTSHLKHYSDLRAANVGSTVALTRLCLPRRIPIHYVSSAGLAVLYRNGDAFPPVSVNGPACSLPPADGSFGYLCSKWASERFLEKAHELSGLRVCIHRPSTIIREGADATAARAPLDWVNALLHYARSFKAVPKVEHNRGALDLVYVRNVCADIVEHVFDNSDQESIKYVHEVGDVVIPMDRLQDIGLEEEPKKIFNVLPAHEWIAKAVSAGLHPAVAALIEIMDTQGGPDYPRLIKTTSVT